MWRKIYEQKFEEDYRRNWEKTVVRRDIQNLQETNKNEMENEVIENYLTEKWI